MMFMGKPLYVAMWQPREDRRQFLQRQHLAKRGPQAPMGMAGRMMPPMGMGYGQMPGMGPGGPMGMYPQGARGPAGAASSHIRQLVDMWHPKVAGRGQRQNMSLVATQCHFVLHSQEPEHSATQSGLQTLHMV